MLHSRGGTGDTQPKSITGRKFDIMADMSRDDVPLRTSRPVNDPDIDESSRTRPFLCTGSLAGLFERNRPTQCTSLSPGLEAQAKRQLRQLDRLSRIAELRKLYQAGIAAGAVRQRPLTPPDPESSLIDWSMSLSIESLIDESYLYLFPRSFRHLYPSECFAT